MDVIIANTFTIEPVQNLITATTEPPRDCRRLNILREYDNKKTKLRPLIFI